MKKEIILVIIALCFLNGVQAQQCTDCSNPDQTGGSYSSKLGFNNTALGDYSFSGGNYSEANAGRSFSFGNYTKTDSNATGAIVLGSHVDVFAAYSFVFGTSRPDQHLYNALQETMMIGFNSSQPTLFISRSPSPVPGNTTFDRTGKVAIGSMTDPQAKLHIYSDDDEPATLFLEPSNWTTTYKAEIWLGNQNHGIAADVDEGMIYQTEENHVFKGGDVYIEDIDKGIIMKSPDGRCWRGTLDNDGSLNFTALDECPGMITSAPENNIEKTEAEAKVYPNPGTTVLTIQTKTYPCQFELYNANGQSVLKKTIDQPETNLNTNNLPAGVYSWNITKDGRLIGNDKWIKASDTR